VVPDTQFVVTRMAYRNNSSKYFVDDVPSTFTEVTKLLKAEGIDLDNNRFLILQVRRPSLRSLSPSGSCNVCYQIACLSQHQSRKSACGSCAAGWWQGRGGANRHDEAQGTGPWR